MIELDETGRQSRQQRVGRYKVWLLQKRLSELSAQVEASVLEARQLIAWRQSYQPLAVGELTDEDKRILEHNHRVRLAEVVQKHCPGALKTITLHKWAFPFNTPVDTNRFPDYPKVISTPMDFSTIKARQDGGYYRDPKDWWNDIMLVFSNAKRYNAPGSDCYLMAQTLQEVAEEKYDKVIAPRLAEEAASTLRDEMYLKKKRAELLNQQVGEAMDAQCAVLFNLMAELHAAIREAKLLASSLCDPMTLEEKQALAATIQALPTAQLESVVAFVASRHPPSVSHSEGQPGGAPSRKVQLNLGRYDPLMLRQLQHLVHTCTAARQQQQQQQPGAGAPLRGAQLAHPRPQAAAAATAGGAEQDRSASASPALSPSPGQQQSPAGAGAGQAPVPAERSVAGAAAVGVGAAPAAGQAGPRQDAASAAAQPAGEGQQQQQGGPGGPQAGAAGGAPAPAPPAPGMGTQRNISDVVTNATASGISLRAGIRWPGLAVGAGVRPRSRALLSLSLDGPATAMELLAACTLPQYPVQRAAGRLSGTKRRAMQSAEERSKSQTRRDPAEGQELRAGPAAKPTETAAAPADTAEAAPGGTAGVVSSQPPQQAEIAAGGNVVEVAATEPTG